MNCAVCHVELPAGTHKLTKYCVPCKHKIRVISVRKAQDKADATLRDAASRQQKPWSLEEDMMLFLDGATITEIARMLGRTRAAVVNRRRLVGQ